MTSSEALKKCLFSGFNRLYLNRKKIDEINVFPVADKDTGTNMARTYKAGIDCIRQNNSQDPLEILSIFSKGMLRNARGNSGVILSVLFKGFSDYLNSGRKLEPSSLYGAFDNALKEAKEALSAALEEGTILSVVIAAKNESQSLSNETMAQAMKKISRAAKKAADSTKEAMPELKTQKTPDSGALGLFYIISAFSHALGGEEEEYSFSQSVTFRKQPSFTKDEYTYCTEYIICHFSDFTKDTFEKELLKIGNSVAVVNDGTIVKVHLHTNYPNLALGQGLRFGELCDIKIDNMQMMKNSEY